MKKSLLLIFMLLMIPSVFALDFTDASSVLLEYNQCELTPSITVGSLEILTNESVCDYVENSCTITAVVPDETDPVYSAKASELIGNASNGQTAFTWGNHALVGYALFSSLSDYWNVTGITTSEILTNSSNGQTAFLWGDHSTEGYLKSYIESDPIFSAAYPEIYANISANTAKISYNDSTIVNNLQLTVAGITSYNDSTVVNNLQAENLNQNSSIELRSPIASPSFTGDVLINGGYGSGGISLTSNGSGLFFEDLLIGGDVLTISGTSVNGGLTPSANATYDIGSHALNWNDLYFDDAYLRGNIYLGRSDNNTYNDGSIYFYDAGSYTGKSFTWNDNTDTFYLNDGLYLNGGGLTSTGLAYFNQGIEINGGYLTSVGDINSSTDLCIVGGICLSTFSSYVSYNDSTVVNQLQSDIIAHNLSIEARTSYNDSTVVNNLQLENIAQNSSIELRSPIASPSFTGTITSAGAINNTFAHGTNGILVTLIDLGNVTIGANKTHVCIKGTSTVCVQS